MSRKGAESPVRDRHGTSLERERLLTDKSIPRTRDWLAIDRKYIVNKASKGAADKPPAPRSLDDVLSSVRKLGQDNAEVSVDKLVESLGRASVAALVLVPALLAATPLSGIPGLSAICGLLIALVSVQAVLGRRHLWLPGFILRRSIDGAKLAEGLDKIRPITAFLDRHTHERLDVLVRGPGAKLLFLLCMVGGMMMPFLEIIPFSASAIATCVTLISLSILTLDGLLAALSLGMLAGAGSLVAYLV